MDQKRILNKSYYLVLFLLGCNYAAKDLAYNIYKNQPKITKEHFKGARGSIISNSDSLATYKLMANDTDYFIAIASSGGGYRATYITLGALLALEQLPSIKGNKNLLTDVDLFSSVSGSGLTISYYLTHRFDQPNFNLSKAINSAIRLDQNNNKTNILRTNLDQTLFKTNSQSIEKHAKKLLHTQKGQLKLKDIFTDKEPKIPLWLINTTVFQNMSGLTITPKNLINLGIARDKAYNLNVSAAVTASMAVPLAVPPLKLASNACKQKCYIYLIDGGISDNLGLTSALNALKNINKKHKILLVIDASQRLDTPFSLNKQPPGALDLLWKIPEMVTSHSNLNPKNIKLIRLKASKFKELLGITTRLNASLEEQELLINIGKKMVMQNKQIAELINGS